MSDTYWILLFELGLTTLPYDIVLSKIYDKRDHFNFEKVEFPFQDGDVPCSPSYGLYISQLIHFAKVFSNVSDSNNRKTVLTA